MTYEEMKSVAKRVQTAADGVMLSLTVKHSPMEAAAMVRSAVVEALRAEMSDFLLHAIEKNETNND